LLATGLSAAVLSGCHASAGPDPNATYQSIYSDFVHGDYDIAAPRAEKARKEFSIGSSESNATWERKFRLLEADILLKQSRWKEVIALLEDGLSFPSSGDLAIKRNLLCSRAHYYLGRPQESDQELREARRLAELGHSALIGDVLRAEALVLRDSGNLDKAIEKFRSSLAAAREYGDPPLQAADLVELGFASLRNGHYDQALVLSQQAANLSRSILARRQMQLALGNAGWAYYDLGDFENALSNFQAAERVANEIGMAGSRRALWLQDAGLAEYKLDNLEEARRYDDEALQSALTLSPSADLDQIANIETNLALLLYQQGQYDAAKTYSDRSLLATRNSKDADVVAYAKFLQGLLASRQVTDPEAERLLTAARQSAIDLDLRTDIENAMANWHSARHEPRQAELWYRRSIQTFEAKRSTVQNEALRLSAFAYGDTAYRDYADFLIEARRPIEALQLLDHSRARTLEEGLGVVSDLSHTRGKDVVDAQTVARKLNARILFYALGPKKSYLWAISAGETRLFALPTRKEIQSLVDEYQRVIQKSSDPLQTANPAAIALYEVLIKPAAAMIPNDSKIFVISDGVLNALNFETLLKPTAEGYKYWIEDVTVTATSSIRILSRLNTDAADAARDLLLIGDPASAGTEFEALPNAPAEIERIQRHFPAEGQTVLTQARAVPAAYTTSGPEQFQYIHFVAHGTASRLSPLDSAVVLSPTQSNPDDFKLYAREILRHPLHARLVTISACYGSGVRTYAGEGLVGLAWAFLRAGSHNVIGALWQADDAATPLLMDRLYGELSMGATPDAALRTAKLSLIHSSSVYRKPLYWAVFQLYAGS
jgi:CHAT domain-containing protein